MLSALLRWIVRGDAPEPTARGRLMMAREELQRQIDILEAGSVNYRDATPERARLIAELRLALSEFEDELAGLDSEAEESP